MLLTAWNAGSESAQEQPWAFLAGSQSAVASLLSCFITWAAIDVLLGERTNAWTCWAYRLVVMMFYHQ